MACEFAMVDLLVHRNMDAPEGRRRDRVAKLLLLDDRTNERRFKLQECLGEELQCVGVLDRFHRWARRPLNDLNE